MTEQDQLQPSLLDRLTDEEPEKKQESRDRRVMSMRRLRDAVLRDLTWLLNTDSLSTTEDLDDYPLVACSVLNYGMTSLSGRTLTSADAKLVERRLRQTICDFEPRLRQDTLKVRVVLADGEMNRHGVNFDIEGQLWSQPAPIRLLLKTQIDLETGDVKISDRG